MGIGNAMRFTRLWRRTKSPAVLPPGFSGSGRPGKNSRSFLGWDVLAVKTGLLAFLTR